MITIYANWSGTSLARGDTLDDARALLTALDCEINTVFGPDPSNVTALDTRSYETILPTIDDFNLLHVARGFFYEVPASGQARIR